MKKLVVVIIGVQVLAGCGRVRYPTSYLLNFPTPPAKEAAPRAMLGPVAVREFDRPAYLCEGRIVYRPTAEAVGFYEHHRWAVSPREAITRLVGDTLRAHSVFENVAHHERDLGEATYVLTGRIEHLEEVDQGSDVQVLSTISAQLMDRRTRTVLWRHTASVAVSVSRRDVSGVVTSLSTATQTVIDRLVASMLSELARAQSQVAPAAGF